MSLARALALSLLSVAPLAAQNERAPEAFSLAIGLQQRGLHDEAAEKFEAFARQNPKHALAAEAQYRLALSRIELKAPDQAIAALRASLAAGGNGFKLRPECHYRLGNLLAAKPDHQGAIAQFEALAKEVPADHYLLAAARYAEGESRRELGDDAKAAAAFAAAAEAATGERASYRFAALYQLGFAQTRLHQLAEAAATFALAAGAGADDAQKGECFYLAGDALLRLEKFDEAARAFGRAVKCGGEFADDAAYGLGWVALGRHDRPAAIAAFGAMLEKFGDSPLAPNARLERGRALYQEQQAAAAQQELTPLLGANVPAPVQQQARELLGLCALATGKSDTAVDELKKALAAAPAADKARLSFALGEALSNAEKWAEAVAAYDAVAADAPPDLRGDAAYGACFALHALGKHRESIARARAVLALQPPHHLAPEARQALAENLFALQQYADAEKEYAALADVQAQRATAEWKRAWCRYLQGDKKGAAARFAAIAGDKQSPNNEEALSMQALALLEAGDADGALAIADQYRARHRDGAFLDRTERVAARALRQKGDLTGAQQRLARAAGAAKAHGADAAATGDIVEQAELAYQQGDFKAADAAFAKLAGTQDAVGARALAGRAWCAFELGDDAACGTALATAKAHPAAAGELPALLELESAWHHRRQQWPAAIASARAFLQQFAGHAKAPAMRYALGVAQARSGDQVAARATFAALAKDGGYERADRVQYELAWACRRDGDEAAALDAFGVVAATSADEELAGEAKLHLGVACLEHKDLDGARRWLEAVRGSHRGRALYRLSFAEFEAAGSDAKKLAVARDRFGEVAARPGDELAGEARYLAAECCVRLDDARGACEKLTALLDKEPQHARADRARLLLGECAVRIGEPDNAVPALEQYLRGKGHERADDAKAQLWLGRARMLRKEYDAAEASLVKVTELSDGPLAAEAQYRIGETRAAKGDLRGAADAFVKLPILYAQPEWVRAGLLQAGLAYERLQQPEKAQRFFRELADKHAGSAEAKTAAEHLRPN
jgi:TolA-binding protein